MSQVDLHIHSTASDGRYSPAEVVRQAAEKGLAIISLTDHDSVDGIKSALEAGDLVLLSDILDYDFVPLTDLWQNLLEQLADRSDNQN